MALPARKLAHVPAKAVTQDQLLRLVRFPAVRKAISGALTRAVPERADIPGARGRFIAFRVADPKAFHPELYATIPVGSRGTLLRIGTPKSQIRKPRELSSFLSRMRRTLKTGDRKSLVYQLRSAGIIGGSRTQSVLVPIERVKAVAARFLSSPAAMRKVGTNPIVEISRGGRKKNYRAHSVEIYSGTAAPLNLVTEDRGGRKTYGQPMRVSATTSSAWTNPLLATMGIVGNPGKNPLTKKEKDSILAEAIKEMHRAALDLKAGHDEGEQYWSAHAKGMAEVALKYGPGGPKKNPIGKNPPLFAAIFDYAGKTQWVGPFKSEWQARNYAKLYVRKLPGLRVSYRVAKWLVPANPLTKKQMAVLRSADLHTAKKIKRGSHLWRLAKKPRCRPYIKVREPQYAPNVQEVSIPFRSGQSITPAQMQKWIDSLPAGAVRDGYAKRFAQSMEQYKRFHLGSVPKSFTYREVPMGSSKGITDVDFVVSEGKEWTAAYQVPSHSKKYEKQTQGRYVHAHGESGVEIADVKHPAPISKLPERFHTADGKFVGVVPSKNISITDWYRG